jgi:hypothetical protein
MSDYEDIDAYEIEEFDTQEKKVRKRYEKVATPEDLESVREWEANDYVNDFTKKTEAKARKGDLKAAALLKQLRNPDSKNYKRLRRNAKIASEKDKDIDKAIFSKEARERFGIGIVGEEALAKRELEEIMSKTNEKLLTQSRLKDKYEKAINVIKRNEKKKYSDELKKSPFENETLLTQQQIRNRIKNNNDLVDKKWDSIYSRQVESEINSRTEAELIDAGRALRKQHRKQPRLDYLKELEEIHGNAVIKVKNIDEEWKREVAVLKEKKLPKKKIAELKEKFLREKSKVKKVTVTARNPLEEIRDIGDRVTNKMGVRDGKIIIQRRPKISKKDLKEYNERAQGIVSDMISGGEASDKDIKKAITVVNEERLYADKKELSELVTSWNKLKRIRKQPILRFDEKKDLTTPKSIIREGLPPVILTPMKEIPVKDRGLVDKYIKGQKKGLLTGDIIKNLSKTKEIREDTREGYKELNNIFAGAKTDALRLESEIARTGMEMREMRELGFSRREATLKKQKQRLNTQLTNKIKAFNIISESMKDGLLSPESVQSIKIKNRINKYLPEDQRIDETPLEKAVRINLPRIGPEQSINISNPDILEEAGKKITLLQNKLVGEGISKRAAQTVTAEIKTVRQAKNTLKSPTTNIFTAAPIINTGIEARIDELENRRPNIKLPGARINLGTEIKLLKEQSRELETLMAETPSNLEYIDENKFVSDIQKKLNDDANKLISRGLMEKRRRIEWKP